MRKGATHGPEIEEEDCRDTGWWERCMWVVLRFRNGDVSSDVPQTDTTTNSSDQQKTSSAILIDKENEVDEREDSLDNTKQTSSEQRGVCASDTDRLEDGW